MLDLHLLVADDIECLVTERLVDSGQLLWQSLVLEFAPPSGFSLFFIDIRDSYFFFSLIFGGRGIRHLANVGRVAAVE